MCQNVLAIGLGSLDCGEITDTDAVEGSFQFARIFDFCNIGFDALVSKLLDYGVRGFLGGLNADLNHILAVFLGLDATGRQLYLFSFGRLGLLC